jgi:hypothetical protein
MQKYNIIFKGAKARQVAYCYKILYKKDKLDNNAYLNCRVKETNAFIIKYITKNVTVCQSRGMPARA